MTDSNTAASLILSLQWGGQQFAATCIQKKKKKKKKRKPISKGKQSFKERKKMFKNYLNTMRLTPEPFKGLTSRSITKLGSGSNCLGVGGVVRMHQNLLCHKLLFQLTLPHEASSQILLWHPSAGGKNRRDISNKYPATVGQIICFSQVLPKWVIWKEALLNPWRENYSYCHVTAPCPLPVTQQWQSDYDITGIKANFGNLQIHSQVSQPLTAWPSPGCFTLWE